MKFPNKRTYQFYLKKAVTKKEVLEIGSNHGDITSQILKMKPEHLVATEIDQNFLSFLRNRYKSNSVVSIRELDIFRQEIELKGHFDTVIIKEIINAFETQFYNDILNNSFFLLKEGGSLIIIDYLPYVHLRQLIVSIFLNPFKTIKFIRRYKYNIKNKKQLNFKKLSEHFIKYQTNILFFNNVDPLNAYDSFMHKFLEKIFPMKYMFIVKK